MFRPRSFAIALPITLTLALALVLGFGLATGCGGSSSETPEAPGSTGTASTTAPAPTTAAMSPEDVALAFFTAAAHDDRASLESLFTDKARAGIADDEGFNVSSESLGEFEIGAATMENGEARVPVTAELDGQSQDMRLLMRRESNEWRMYGFDISMGGEGWMTFNLESIEEMMAGLMEGMATEMADAMEDAFSDWSQGGSPEEIAAARAQFESLQPLTRAQHDDAWTVDVRADGQPASEVLATLLDGTGMTFDVGSFGDEFTTRLTAEWFGVSRLEAVERTCAMLDVHPIYPDPDPALGGWMNDVAQGMADGMAQGLASTLEGSFADESIETSMDSSEPGTTLPTVSFAAGARTTPVAFAGPFLIEVAELVEKAPTTTGTLTVAVRGLGLAPACMAYQTEMVEICTIEAVEGPNGENLNGDDGVTFLSTPETAQSYLVDTTQVDLMGLLRGVETISSVRGRVSFTIPTTVAEARCTVAVPGAVRAGTFDVDPQDWGTYTTLDVTGADGAEIDTAAVEVRVSPIDANGQPMGTLMSDSMGWGEMVRASVQTPEVPQHVDVKVCTTETLAYSFELTNIPLTRFAEMPAQRAQLQFDGSTPFTAEFVRFTKRDADFPEVELTLINGSNKDATSVLAEFHYMDASGIELESFQHTITGTFTMDGVQPFAAETTETHRTTAFFMPEETASVRVVVNQVEFDDATTWSRAD